jgi:hypothetical protein
MLRHTVAALLLHNGADVRVVQEFLVTARSRLRRFIRTSPRITLSLFSGSDIHRLAFGLRDIRRTAKMVADHIISDGSVSGVTLPTAQGRVGGLSGIMGHSNQGYPSSNLSAAFSPGHDDHCGRLLDSFSVAGRRSRRCGAASAWYNPRWGRCARWTGLEVNGPYESSS